MSKNQLQTIVQQSGLEPSKAEYILKEFQNYFQIAGEWEQKAKAIVVTNENQKAEMQMARAGRLFLREKRIAVEKARKKLKEQALREGKAIDGIANVLKALIVPIEEHLEKQEKYIENKKKEKEKAIRLEIEQRIEEERIAKEKAEAKERERIRKENERLKKEAEEKERKMQEERERAQQERKKQEELLRKQKEAALRRQKEIEEKAREEWERALAEERIKAAEKQKVLEERTRKERKKAEMEAAKIKAVQEERIMREREERERIELELRKREEAEAKAKKEAEELAEKQNAASDQDKLLHLADIISKIPIPEVKSKQAKSIIITVKNLLGQTIQILTSRTERVSSYAKNS